MSQATKSVYRNDLIIQGIVYIPMMIFDVLGLIETEFFILGALLQLAVGFVQVMSGALHSIRYRDMAHQRYFIGAIGYLAFLFLGGMLLNVMRGPAFLVILFLFLIPVGIATWYYRLTWIAYQNAPESINADHSNYGNFQEDILDDILW